MDDQKTMVVSVHAKDCVDYQCRRCGQCCRHIKDSLMVESLDAYRLANYLRGRDPNICTIDDVLTRYCEPMDKQHPAPGSPGGDGAQHIGFIQLQLRLRLDQLNHS